MRPWALRKKVPAGEVLNGCIATLCHSLMEFICTLYGVKFSDPVLSMLVLLFYSDWVKSIYF